MRLHIVVTCSLLLCLSGLSAFAEVYKTKDKDGRVVYTDKPKTENAEKVELREVNTIPSVESSPVVKLKRPKQEAVNYQIAILSPTADTIVPVTQRDLKVAVSVNPGLNDGVVLAYSMDGQVLQETTDSSITIKEIPVGIHSLVVEAIDSEGQSLGRSDAVSVSVIRPSLKKPDPKKPPVKKPPVK
jgi:Domain of unknown function (DUF4124)